MIPRNLLVFGPLALAAAGLTACASLFGGEPVKVRPVENMSSVTPAQGNPLYESAVTAINARDYARALDYLQEAKTRDPRDIKVLNALGVVYDKLGRFDLSTRYYTQARAVDPNSRIVAANMGYSEVLQHLQGVDQHPSVAALEAPDGKALPEVAAVMPSPTEAMTSHAVTVEMQPINAANAPRSVIFAPAMQPVESPIVVASIAPNVVAAPGSRMEKRISVLPEFTATAASAARPAEKQTAALATPAQTKPETNTAIIVAPISPTMTVPVQEKLSAAMPIHATSIAPVASRPEKQMVASLASSRTMTETNEPGATSNPPAVVVRNVPVAKKLTEVPLVHAASVVPVIRPAEIETATILTSLRTISETREAVIAAPNLRAAPAQNVPVAKKLPQVLPLHFPSVAPVAHLEKKQVIAVSVPSIAKPAAPVTAGRITIPAAFHPTAVPVVPVKAVLSAPSSGKVLTLGKPVNILNASGKPGGVGPVSHRLTILGWTIKQSDWRMQAATTLYYPAKNIVAAKAMLRTLPFPARLMPDNNSNAFAMQLVIGRDYLSWKPRNSRLAALWQKGTVVASLQKPLTRGVR